MTFSIETTAVRLEYKKKRLQNFADAFFLS